MNLRHYQEEAIRWLIRKERAGLFARPGAGKTLIALNYLDVLKRLGKARRVLVVAPKNICSNVWPQQVDQWGFDFENIFIHGKTKDEDVLKNLPFMTLINPHGLPWLLSKRRPLFDAMVVDESSTLKAPLIYSKKTKAFKHVLSSSAVLIAKDIRHRVIMTGNMAPNSLEDLYTQIYMLDEGARLGKNYFQFLNRFFKKSMFNRHTPLPFADKQVSSILSDIVFTVDPNLVDCPDVMTNDVWVTMDAKAQAIYDEAETELFAFIDGQEGPLIEGVVAGRSKYSLCRQIAQGAYYKRVYSGDDIVQGEPVFVHDEKIQALKSIIDELNTPLLIGTAFKFSKPQIAEIGARYFEGEARTVDEWNKGQIKALAGNPESVGLGLNLQGGDCRDVAFLTLPEKPVLYPQFYSRVARQGCKADTVIIHRILTKNTVDQVTLRRLERKNKNENDLFEMIQDYRLEKERRRYRPGITVSLP